MQLSQKPLPRHDRHHEIGWHCHVVAGRATLQFGQELLIASERIHYHLGTSLFLKLRNQLRADIIRPREVIKRDALLWSLLRRRLTGRQARDAEKCGEPLT